MGALFGGNATLVSSGAGIIASDLSIQQGQKINF